MAGSTVKKGRGGKRGARLSTADLAHAGPKAISKMNLRELRELRKSEEFEEISGSAVRRPRR